MIFEVKMFIFNSRYVEDFVSVVWGTLVYESSKPFLNPDSSPWPACQGRGPGRVRLSWLQIAGVS